MKLILNIYHYNDVMHVKFGQAGLGIAWVIAPDFIETSKMDHNKVTNYCNLMNHKTNKYQHYTAIYIKCHQNDIISAWVIALQPIWTVTK